MQILHISESDKAGGAAIAAYRTCQAQRDSGLDARMLVRQKAGTDAHVVQVPEKITNPQSLEDYLHDFLQNTYIHRNRSALSDTHFSLGLTGTPIAHLADVRDADILHLHWIAGFVSPQEIRTLLDMGKKVVWTLHDQWAFTAGYHYPKWENGHGYLALKVSSV